MGSDGQSQEAGIPSGVLEYRTLEEEADCFR